MTADSGVTVAPASEGVVCTFYSYKGGVGRSMALANIAALLAKWGKKVLIIDWDLEAPGIEKFFQRWLRGDRRSTDGLVELIRSSTASALLDWRSCLIQVALPKAAPIAILHAGRDDKELYAKRLREINWDALFEKHRFGARLEQWRNEWRNEYDYVLVDSRTGITDIGGVCSIFLPDILITLFTATEQSLNGVHDVMVSAREAHSQLPVDRRRLLIVPIPSRDESGSEYKLAAEWRGRFAKELNEFFLDWMPKDETADRILNHLKIPYFAYWSFGERLPVMEEDPDNPKTLAFSYQLIARLLFGKLDWEEVRQGTKAGEAQAAQKVAIEERAAEAARIRSQAQHAELAREASQREQKLREESVRLENFLFARFAPTIRVQRLSLLVMASVAAISCAGAIMALRWAYDSYLRTIAYGASQSLAHDQLVANALFALVLSIAAAFATVWAVLRSRRHLRMIEKLQSERALFEAGAGSYAIAGGNAFAQFVQNCEHLIEAEGRSASQLLRGGQHPSTPASSEIITQSVGFDTKGTGPIEEGKGAIKPRGATSAHVSEVLSVTQPGQPTLPAEAVDVFVSYRSSQIADGWLREFVPLLRAWVAEYVGRDIVVFAGGAQLSPGLEINQPLLDVLKGAKSIIPVLSKAYFASAQTSAEWQLALRQRGHLVPVALSLQDLPQEARSFEVLDFSEFAFVGEGFSKTERYVEFQGQVQKLALLVAQRVTEADSRAAE